MPLLEARDVTIDTTPTINNPRGFLHARHLGLDASAEYDTALLAIVGMVERHLDAYGIAMDATAGRYKLAALYLARHYAAEAVLSSADTGTDRDQTGASTALSANDLAHWQKMRDDSLEKVESILGSPPGDVRSGVYFPKVRLEREDDAAS